MTRDEARRRAVEAAREAARNEMLYPEFALDCAPDPTRAAIAAYERAMAAAGWRMVRDCGDSDENACLNPYADDWGANAEIAYNRGWNACRRAMLGED